MINLLLRFGVLAVGLVMTLVVWQSWTFGEPPPWSIFAARGEAIVVKSQVEEGRAGNGTTRFTPVVEVQTQDGVQPLAGIEPSFFSFDNRTSTGIVADYPVGRAATVRWVNGRPMADRYDLFGMAHTAFVSLMTLFLLFLGGFLAWALGPERKPRPRA